MAIDERRRHELHEAARQGWGDEVAGTLMELLPPVGWSDVATRRDLDALEARIGARFEVLESHVDSRLARLEARLLRWLVPSVLGGMTVAAAFAALS